MLLSEANTPGAADLSGKSVESLALVKRTVMGINMGTFLSLQKNFIHSFSEWDETY